MKYSIEDIKIGDQVFFNSTDQQNNFDQYWTVTEKKGDILMIELRNSERHEEVTVNVKEVVGHIHRFFV